MKNKFLMKIFAISTILGSAGVLGFGIPLISALTAQDINSPNLICSVEQQLEKGDSTGLTPYEVKIDQTDQSLDVTFGKLVGTSRIGFLPKLAEGEKYFAVLIDSDNKGPIKNVYLEQQEDGRYKCSFEAPYYCNWADIHVYKQGASDPAFNINPENFMGRVKALMAHDSVYTRGEAATLTKLDSAGNEMSGGNAVPVSLSRITPNIYSIKVNSDTTTTHEIVSDMGRIVLPDAQADLLTLDEKTIPGTYFTPGAKSAASESAWQNAFTQGSCFNFYIPDGVNEFYFQVFRNEVSDDSSKILYQFHIKLNRS